MSEPFPPLFTGIQQTADELHALQDRVSSLAFADDRGYLNSKEEKELRTLSKTNMQRSGELDEMVSVAVHAHQDSWRRFTEERIALLGRVQEVLRRNPVPVGGLSPGFLEASLPDLLSELLALRDGEATKYTTAWALAVSKYVIESSRSLLQ